MTRSLLKGETAREARLIELASRGDKNAFEQLYNLHNHGVYTLCLRMTGDTHTAEDITQEIFIRLWSKIKTYRGESAFRTWLYRLSFNVITRQRKKLRIHGHDELKDEAVEDSQRGLADKLDLERAIAALPVRCRAVLVMHDLLGHTHVEIAAALGISEGASKSHLFKAKNKIRQELSK